MGGGTASTRQRSAALYDAMPSVTDLVEESALEQLAGREALSAGLALAEHGNVTLVEFGPERVVAHVVDRGVIAHVYLAVAGSTLQWSCDCRRGAAAGACRHVAAAGIETWRRSPRGRS
jgi:uncharacterized Zn finger protein